MSIITRNPSLLRRPAIAPLLTKASLPIPLYRHFPRLQTYPAANLGQYRWSSTTFPKTPSFPINSKGFPNFFYPENEDAKQKTLAQINLAMEAILRRLEVPYIDPDSGQVKTNGFFTQAEAIVHKQDPSAKVYISGGVVRSILGWIYAELYKEYEKNPSVMNPEKVLSEIICSSEPLCKSDVLGAGSDLDLLIDFSRNLSSDRKNQVQKELASFINNFGETILDSVIKRSLLAVADINEYEPQTTRSVLQGGSPLDWLAFPLTRKSGSAIRIPSAHPDIMENFLKGEIRFEPIRKTGRNGLLSNKDQKGIIRQFRPLMEIPFLKPTAQSNNLILKDCENLLKMLLSGNEISYKAIDQLEKSVRNCRFSTVCNQIAIPDQHTTDLDKSIRKISYYLKNPEKNCPVIPELLPRKNIENRPDDFDPGNLRKQSFLITYADFISKYTDRGWLYHGTPEIDNIVSMVRCGLVVSTQQEDRPQGQALYGRGFYATHSMIVASDYTRSNNGFRTGMVFPFSLAVSHKLRILDLDALVRHNQESYKKLNDAAYKEKMDFHEFLEKKMDIDVIIPIKATNIVIILNQDALSFPKTPKELFTKTILQITGTEILKEIKSQRVLEIYRECIGLIWQNKWIFHSQKLQMEHQESIISALRDPTLETKMATANELQRIPSNILSPFVIMERKFTLVDLIKDHKFKTKLFSMDFESITSISEKLFIQILEDPITEIAVYDKTVIATIKNRILNDAVHTEVQRKKRILHLARCGILLACCGILLSIYDKRTYDLVKSGDIKTIAKEIETAIMSSNLPIAASQAKSIIYYSLLLNSQVQQELSKDITEVLNPDLT